LLRGIDLQLLFLSSGNIFLKKLMRIFVKIFSCAFLSKYFFIIFMIVIALKYILLNSTMNKFEKACIKGRILQLAKLKSTGTPSELAAKFEISVRTVKRLIREIRDDGVVIKYDFNCISYVIL